MVAKLAFSRDDRGMMTKAAVTGKVDRHGNTLGGAEASVSATNDSSIVSKLSACIQGYYSDPFVHNFCRTRKRRAPLINRGYGIRYLAVDWAFERFLASTCEAQVLVLGAGFDTLYFRSVEKRRPFLKWIEVDFPEVIRRKRECIKHSELQKCAEDPRYILIGADLLDHEASTRALAAVCDFSVPTFILAEVVLTYLPTKDADAIIQWVAGVFKHPTLCLYEQIRPHTAFGQIMCRHFDKIGSSICPLHDYPTLTAQEDRMRSLGYSIDCCMDLHEFKKHVAAEILQWQELEFFDEYEEWMLKLRHYMLLVAYKSENHPRQGSLLLPYLGASTAPCAVRRYACALSSIDGHFLIYGGFGSDAAGSHRRLATAICTTDFTSIERYPLSHAYPMFAQFVGERAFGGRGGPASVPSFLPRWRHGLAATTDGVIVCGGRNSASMFADVWRFKDTWVELSTLPTARCSMPMCSVTHSDGSMGVMAFGGLDENEQELSEAVDVITGLVYPFPAMFGAQAVPYKHGALVCDESRLTFWWRDGYRSCDIRCSPDFLMINFNMAVLDRHLCLIGGGGNLFSFGTHVNACMLRIDLAAVDALLVEDENTPAGC